MAQGAREPAPSGPAPATSEPTVAQDGPAAVPALAARAAEVPTGPTWERLEDQLQWYDGRSRDAQRRYKTLKVVELVVAGSVPVIAAMAAPPWVTAGVAAVVVVLEGVNQLFQWQPQWVRYRSTAESLKHERYLYLAKAGPYRSADRPEILAERIEGLLTQERTGWAQSRSRRSDDAEAGTATD